ncbi:MAG: hypothetical protein ACMG6S_15595, partial [Byssovorax sp.]
AGVPDPKEAVREIDLALAPEVSLADIELRPAEQAHRPGPTPSMHPMPGTGELLGSFLEMLGLPPADVATIPGETLRQIEQKMLELTRGPQTPARMMELMGLLNELGISPLDAFGPRPRKKKR